MKETDKSGKSTDNVVHETDKRRSQDLLSVSQSSSTMAEKCSPQKHKTNSSQPENDDTDTLPSPAAKRLKSDISDSNHSDDISPLSAILPHQTCNWTDFLFPRLQIWEEKSCEDAMIIFSNAYHDLLKGESYMLQELNEIFNLKPDKQMIDEQKCFEHAVTYGITIDCNRLDDVYVADLEHMEVQLNEVLASAVNIMENNVRNIWERTVWRSLEMFLSQLFHMVRRRNEDPSNISEGMFTELFMCFIRIFGLEIFGFSNVKGYKLKVGPCSVISLPDAIIYNPRQRHTDCSQVMAAVMVKKDNTLKREHCSDYESQCMSEIQHSHLTSEIKGQNLGEMLSLLPSSVFGTNGIFGFIVQGTNVTLVSLAVDKNYLDCLVAGQLQGSYGKVAYSQEYNILTKAGRRGLVQTLSHLSAMSRYLNKCHVQKSNKIQN